MDQCTDLWQLSLFRIYCNVQKYRQTPDFLSKLFHGCLKHALCFIVNNIYLVVNNTVDIRYLK